MTETTIALIGAIMMAVILFFNVTKKIPIMISSAYAYYFGLQAGRDF